MTPLAQSTATRLNRAVAAAPAAFGELLARYSCDVPASAESLALMSELYGDAFGDDLFIVLRQAERATGQRYASATGTDGSAATSQQRSALGNGLKSIVDFLRGQLSINTSGTAGGIDYTATNDPAATEEEAPRVLGLAQPVFIVGVVALVLVVVVLIVHHVKK